MKYFILACICVAALACGPDDENNASNNTNNANSSTNNTNNTNNSNNSRLNADLDVDAFGWMLHVNARSTQDMYVVGGSPDAAQMLHFDGQAWSNEVLPSAPLLNWIHLFESEAVAVGNDGTVLSFDGDEWVLEETSTDQDLWGVFGSSTDDVWAVGGAGREDGQATILRRQNGMWTEVESPALVRPGVNAWFKVWGTGADNVWIVGQNGGILQWNGTDLVEFGAGTSSDLISVSGTGPDNVVAVGGRGNGVIARFDGTDWSSQDLAPAPGVNGLWLENETTVWLAGVNGLFRRATRDDEGVFEVPRVAPASMLDLHAVTGFKDVGVIAVGGNFSQPQGPYQGAVVTQELP